MRAPGRQGLPPPRPGHPRVPDRAARTGPDRTDTGPDRISEGSVAPVRRPAGARSKPINGSPWGCYPPNSGNDSTGLRRPARTSTPHGGPTGERRHRGHRCAGRVVG